jgi:glycosyltransferase involved in cell wall biosynthesis
MHPEMRHKVRVSFLGEEGDEYQMILDEYGLKQNVTFEGYLSHKEAIEKIFGSDLLLLLSYTGSYATENARIHLTGKVFEYMVTGIPILALTEEGILADAIKKTRSGYVVQPTDICRISEKIHWLYLLWESQNLSITPDWELIKAFDREKITEDLAQILEDLYLRAERDSD